MPDDQTDDLGARLARLEADLATEREEKKAMSETLRALDEERKAASGAANRQRGGAPLARLSREEAQDLADELGGDWTPALVQQHFPVIEAMFRRVARPVLQGINGMADVVDELHTRSSVKDWDTLAEAAEKVRQEHVAQGQFISRKQAAAIVKSRRLEDPKFLDERLEERAKARQAEEERVASERTAATTEGTGRAPTQTSGPSPSKDKGGPMTREKFESLSLEEKRAHMENVAL